MSVVSITSSFDQVQRRLHMVLEVELEKILQLETLPQMLTVVIKKAVAEDTDLKGLINKAVYDTIKDLGPDLVMRGLRSYLAEELGGKDGEIQQTKK